MTAKAAQVLQAIDYQRDKLHRALVVAYNRFMQGWGKYLGWPSPANT